VSEYKDELFNKFAVKQDGSEAELFCS